jgi:hypothetical protein
MSQGALLTLYGRVALQHVDRERGVPDAAGIELRGEWRQGGARPRAHRRRRALSARGWRSLQAKFDGEFSATTSTYSGTGVVKKEW